jgi:hypothetical protein
MSVTKFKEYRNEIIEGASGPTRMEIQKFFDKEKGTQRARLNKTSQHFNIRDVIVNAKGTVVGYKMEEVETEKYNPDKPAYAGSRHKKIEKDKYRKRKGYAAMTDDLDEGYEKTISLWMKDAFAGVDFHFKSGALHVPKGYRGKVARRMAVDKIKAPVGGIKEARTFLNRKDDEDKEKKRKGITPMSQKKKRWGSSGYGKGEEVEVEEGTVLAMTDVDQWTHEIYKGINAGWKSVGKSTLGGDENVAIMIKLTLEPEKDWPNKILHNASYAMIRIATNGTMEMFASGLGKGKNMRKTKIKSAKDVVTKINKWINTVSEEVVEEEVEVDGRKKGYREALARINSRKAKVEEKKKEKPPVFKGTPRQIRQQMKDWKKKNDKLHIGEEEIEEAKILKKGAKVQVAHPAKGKGMVTGKVVRYDDQGPGSPFYIVDIGEPRSEKVPAHKIKEETEIDEAKSAYDKQIAAFLKKGGKIKKLAVSKKEVAKAAAEFRKSHKNMTQKELELDIEDRLEKQANAEGVIIADEKLFLVTEEISEKDYDDLKKGDTVALEYGSAMSGGKAKFKVTAKNVVNKGKVGKVTLKSVAKPNSVKFYLYKRGNKVSAAQGDMGVNVKSFRIEQVDLGESQELQAKMALDDAGIKYKEKNNSIVIKKKDLKKAQRAFEKSFKKGGWPTLKTEEVLTEAADRDEVMEFKAFIENDPRLEKQKIIPIVKNIQRRMKAGTYDHKKAPKLWMYLVKEAAKLYAKEFDGMKYSSEVHKEVASQLADDYKAEIEAQDGEMYESKFYTDMEQLFEVLKSKDKSVIDAFYDKKPLEGRMLNTDGVSLEKTGMGGQEIAHWEKGKIKITAVSDVKSTESILKYMKKTIPQANFEDRDYRKEYDNYQGKPEQIARRSSRNQARRIMGDKTEEGKDVGHKDNNPLNNDPKNLRNEDPSKNRREPRLRKMESFSDYFNRPFISESSRNDIYNGSISAGVELEKYAKKSGGIDKDDLLATATILKKGKLPSAKQIPGDTEPRDKVFSIMGKHLSKQYLKKYKGLSPAMDSALKEHWELEERKLSDGELKRREEIAQELDDDKFKKRYGDDWKSVKMGVATNMAKKEAMESVDYVWFEARYKYKIDHKTYTSAVEEALIVADKQGYEVDMDDYFNKIATGPRKPQEGKTNIFKIALEKGGKEQKKKLQIQIYGKGKHGYELNCYIQ